MVQDRTIGIFGLPGQGKTTVLSAIATDSMNGKPFLDIPAHEKVYSTVAIPGCYQLDPHMIGVVDFSNSLLLIDEASQFFDAREWKTFPPHVRTFFQVARHEHTSIVVCSQSYIDCDVRIRNLCFSYYLLENFPFLPHTSVVKPIRHLMGVNNGQICEYFQVAAPIQWKWIFRKKYYSLFDSFCSFVTYEPNDAEIYPGVNYLLKSSKKDRKRFPFGIQHGDKLPRSEAGAACPAAIRLKK